MIRRCLRDPGFSRLCIELRLVTDRQTDRHSMTGPLSCGKKSVGLIHNTGGPEVGLHTIMHCCNGHSFKTYG